MHSRLLICGALITAAAVAPAQRPARDSISRRAAIAGTVATPRPSPTSTGFHIGGLPPGVTQFTAMRLGFTAVNFAATLSPDSTLVVDLRMRAAQQLHPATKEVDSQFSCAHLAPSVH